jgi:hypothetical protein
MREGMMQYRQADTHWRKIGLKYTFPRSKAYNHVGFYDLFSYNMFHTIHVGTILYITKKKGRGQVFFFSFHWEKHGSGESSVFVRESPLHGEKSP